MLMLCNSLNKMLQTTDTIYLHW